MYGEVSSGAVREGRRSKGGNNAADNEQRGREKMMMTFKKRRKNSKPSCRVTELCHFFNPALTAGNAGNPGACLYRKLMFTKRR